MYPYIHIVLPSYMVMAFIGGFCALVCVYFRLDKYQLEFTEFLKMFFLCIIGGLIGSKLVFIITQIPWLIQNFTIENLVLLIPQSGYVFYGGLLGVLFTITLNTKNDVEKRQDIFELIAPAIPLFHGFGRIGCFLAGCCYGKQLPAPIIVSGVFELGYFPVQIVESMYEFMLCLVLLFISKYRIKLDLLKYYLVAYAIFRFAIEFLRGDEVRGILLGLSTSQWISIFILLFYVYKRFSRGKLTATKNNV